MAARMKKTETAVDEVFDISEEQLVEQPVVKKAKARVNTKNGYILCHSVTAGGLHINCRSGNVYDFKKYGAENEIEYYDLVNLVRKRSEHIFNPRIVIDDEEFLEEFPQVARVYDDMYTTRDLVEVLNLPNNQMRSVINNLPVGAKTTLKSLVATEIANGHLDSISKVRLLSEIFNSDFNLLSELFVK